MLREYLSQKFISQYGSMQEAQRVLAEKPNAFSNFVSQYITPYGREGIILDENIAKEMMNFYRKYNIPMVLDATDTVCGLDKYMGENPEIGFKSSSDLLLLHKTDYLPINDTIYTKESTGFTQNIYFRDPTTGDEHTVPYLSGSDTVHFTLNAPVRNHEYGNNWDNMKYGIIAPLSSVSKSRLLDVKSEDTYTLGDTHFIGKYYLFCPKGERDMTQKKNPHATIVEYDRELGVTDAMQTFVSFLGKKSKTYGAFGWGKDMDIQYFRDPDEKYLSQIIEAEKLPSIPDKMHSETEHMARRMLKKEYSAYMALIEYNKEHHIPMDEPETVSYVAIEGGNAQGIPGSVPSNKKLFKEVVFPLLAQHGYKLTDEIFEGIEDWDQMKIISNGFTSIPVQEQELSLRIIKLIQERTPDKNLIEENQVK